MANIFEVARYILNNSEKMDATKLQRLCYYSQAWSLVWNNEVLFDETFAAWRTGPCNADLNETTRGIYPVFADDLPVTKNTLTEKQKDTINNVLREYGSRDTFYLTQLAMMEKPWKETKFEQEISNQLIKEYYSSL